ncbi:hypothetical protein [Micromonospora sp. DT201]|uniref:hypothetical protein n=1 Tax=Micromonospora sp. DT201 TaxID=3393442 RepID=UPI003CE91E87
MLDEPVAALDPLARRTFLQGLMELAAEQGMSIVMSSHLVADLERVCDYLIVLVASRVRVAGDVDDLLAAHHRLVGHRRDTTDLGAGRALVDQSHTDVQSTLVVRSTAPIDDPSWQVGRLDLEDIVLAYMSGIAGNGSPAPRDVPEVAGEAESQSGGDLRARFEILAPAMARVRRAVRVDRRMVPVLPLVDQASAGLRWPPIQVTVVSRAPSSRCARPDARSR